VGLDLIPVGNLGNADDIHGYGGVAYAYDIGKYEVTAGQYCEFLNAVAADDTYGLYNERMADPTFIEGDDLPFAGCNIQRVGSAGSYTYSIAAEWADRPVNYVSWGDVARFANWLTNGQPTGAQDLTTTEDGSYPLNGATSSTDLKVAIAARKYPGVGERFYYMPSEDEWYKPAYHKNDGVTGNYFDSPTSTDVVPAYIPDGGSVTNPDPGNVATYDGDAGIDGIGPPYYRTEAGEHENSASPYGTFDMAGNIGEWTEGRSFGSFAIVRGGAFPYDQAGLHADYRRIRSMTRESGDIGFRISSIELPEPTPPEPQILGLEVFYNGKFADATDATKSFLAVGQASSMSLIGDDLHGNVTNYAQGITGLRITFTKVVAFSGGVAAAFSYEATPEQSSDKTFTAFTPPTAPAYLADDGSGKTIVTITFTNGEIKNRWLKTVIDAAQVTAGGFDLDGELPSPLTLPSGDGTAGGDAEFIIGNRVGDIDVNYRCLLNDAIAIRSHVSGALVGVSNAYDIDKNERILLNEAIMARNAVSGTALPALP